LALLFFDHLRIVKIAEQVRLHVAPGIPQVRFAVLDQVVELCQSIISVDVLLRMGRLPVSGWCWRSSWIIIERASNMRGGVQTCCDDIL